MLFSIILGAIIAFTASRKKDSSKTLELSLIIMPAIVQTIIMMVNGKVGTGAAAGTGYLGVAVSLTIMICIVVLIVYYRLMPNEKEERVLKVAMAADKSVNYVETLNSCAYSQELIGIKDSSSENIKKYYHRIILKPGTDEKSFVDAIYHFRSQL